MVLFQQKNTVLSRCQLWKKMCDDIILPGSKLLDAFVGFAKLMTV